MRCSADLLLLDEETAPRNPEHASCRVGSSILMSVHGRNFDAVVCKVNLKHIPQTLKSHMQSLRTLIQLLKIPPLSTLINPNIFVNKKPMQNCITIIKEREEEKYLRTLIGKEREKTLLIVANTFSHSARTNNIEGCYRSARHSNNICLPSIVHGLMVSHGWIYVQLVVVCPLNIL